MPTVDYAAKLERNLERIEESDLIHPDNKEAIQEFVRDLKLEGMSNAWLSKLTTHLFIIGEHLEDTRYEAMETDDVKDLVEWAQDRDVKDRTVDAYQQAIKRFWRWLYDLPEGEHPEMVQWINTGGSSKVEETLPTDLLNPEEVEALKEACRNPRDRAFIAMLYETGARIGELIDLTVGDIEDHDHGRKVVIDGKTGQRRLPLLESTPAINKWLNEHPDPQKDSALWCQLRDGSKQLSYHYIRQKLLERAKDRTDIEKPVNPHHFRHSRATYLANEFKEAQLCEWFGWVQGSDVPAKYVHLSGRDIDDAYNELHGLKTEEEKESERTIRQCPRCEELNERGDQFCSRCGQALDVEAAQEVETAEAATTEAANEEDLQLALQLVRAMQTDREEVEAFVTELAG